MKFGILIFVTDRSIPITELAKAVEERGFESLWIPEHTHIPVEIQTPFPFSPDGVMPEQYWRTLDPFVALTAAAMVTRTLKLGTGICLVSEREPIVMAKQVASLDVLSGGRLLFGIGAGWLREEMEPLGTPFEARWQITAERVAAMKRLWQDDEAEYHGRFVQVPRTRTYPKPQQQPHPPILIGATSHWARQRAVDWGDGWLPYLEDPTLIRDGIADLRDRARRAGRDPEAVPTSVITTRPDAAAVCQRAGADRCIFIVPSGPAATALPEIDRRARWMQGRA